LEFEFILDSGSTDAAAKKTKSKKDIGASTGTDVDELGDGAMERNGTGSREERRIEVDGKERVGAWGRHGTGNTEAAIVNGALDVGRHVDGDGTVIKEGKVHAKEIMVGTAGNRHGTKMGFKGSNDLVDNGRFDM
jgi:hypothetical protein